MQVHEDEKGPKQCQTRRLGHRDVFFLKFTFYFLFFYYYEAHEGPQQPTTANAGQRRPTAANEGQCKAHDSQRRPTKAIVPP
jgi:hypothetical protein